MENKGKCLVLGANGFIGSHIVDELASEGYFVRAYDKYSTEPQFIKHPSVEVYRADLYNEAEMAKALTGVDYVFHSFSATTPYSSEDDPYSDIDKNLKPSIRIFGQCVEAGVKKIIFLSSGGAIYGHLAEERSINEDGAATPVSPYGINKLAIENYLAYFNRKFGLDYVVYRLTNPYGPRQMFRNHQGVIPAFLEQIRNHGRLTVFGDGSASRDYIYINDATKMILGSFAEQTKHRTYNIGSGQQTTVNDIISALKKITNEELVVTHEATPKTFLNSAQINVDRFVNEFSISAKTSLETGLKATINEYA